MNQRLLALAFQDDSSMWIILVVVLVILFFIVAIVAIGLAIFFIMRKRSKDQKAAAQSDTSLSAGPSASAYAGMSMPETSPPAYEPAAVPPTVETSHAAYESPAPTYESPAPVYESPAPVYESPAPAYESPAPVYEDSPAAVSTPDTAPFDPSRTVAILRENTVEISYGTIKFVSGVLSGEQFQVDPEGAYIGRESTLSQIVVADPRISKRHLWIGVRDGVVKIVDHDSRNGTFINDPKSERITEAALNSGDTVIMGESDVARFEFQAG